MKPATYSLLAVDVIRMSLSHTDLHFHPSQRENIIIRAINSHHLDGGTVAKNGQHGMIGMKPCCM